MYRRAQKTNRDPNIPKRHYFDITIGSEEITTLKNEMLDMEAARKNRATCNINQLILSCKENQKKYLDAHNSVVKKVIRYLNN